MTLNISEKYTIIYSILAAVLIFGLFQIYKASGLFFVIGSIIGMIVATIYLKKEQKEQKHK